MFYRNSLDGWLQEEAVGVRALLSLEQARDGRAAGLKCLFLWPQCCPGGPGEPECPVASACCLCPRVLAE